MINKFRTVALAASSILMMGAAAQAADLYTPAPMPAYTGGWYFSAFGGANWLNDTAFSIDDPTGTVENSYDAGFVVGGAIGYDFGQAMGPLGVRLEAEISYRDNDVDDHVITVQGVSGSATDPFGNTSAFAGMGNILFDLNTGSPFSFYGGGGIGVANVEFDNHGADLGAPTPIVNDDDTVFAWQAIAGMGYEISPGWVLDVQYRYFNASDVSLSGLEPVVLGTTSSSTDYESHSVLAGIRVKF